MKGETRHSHIAERVRMLREKHGLNQTQLARKAGVSQQSVSSMETENTESVRLITIYKIAEALGVCGVCLQCEDATLEIIEDGSLCRLMHRYCRASPESRDWINQVADRETR